MSNKTVVVIGGSSGIGFEVSNQLRKCDANLIIVGRNQNRLNEAFQKLERQVVTKTLDAHNEIELEKFFSLLGPVDHLVSMIGDSMSGGFLTTSSETMRHVIHSKFYTNWLIGKYAAAKLREGGSITFTAGTGGKPQDVCASYVANQGIKALVEGLAVELAPKIRVNAVSPTFMGDQTNFRKDIPTETIKKIETNFIQKVPLKRLATIAEVASGYINFISNSYITGQVFAVDGGSMLSI
jgi:NAD(P)-dependent dehydrogenase (short-subunit alcohol dehydrogenase family)